MCVHPRSTEEVATAFVGGRWREARRFRRRVGAARSTVEVIDPRLDGCEVPETRICASVAPGGRRRAPPTRLGRGVVLPRVAMRDIPPAAERATRPLVEPLRCASPATSPVHCATARQPRSPATAVRREFNPFLLARSLPGELIGALAWAML